MGFLGQSNTIKIMSNFSFYLSPSRIKTFQSCSLKYYYNYELKIESESNDGNWRGDIVHRVLECLARDDRRARVERFIKEGRDSVWNDTTISRFIKMAGGTSKFYNEDNVKSISHMIYAALASDFYGEEKGFGKPIQSYTEFPFEIQTPTYQVKGFLDRVFVYENGSAFIVDYKTSKDYFKGKDLEENLQDFIYKMAVSEKLSIAVEKISTQFLFLKFLQTSNFIVQTQPTSSFKINGIKNDLAFWQSFLEEFWGGDESSYLENNAYDKGFLTDGSFGGILACGKFFRTDRSGTPKTKADRLVDEVNDEVFICPFRAPRTVYVEKKDGVVLRRHLEMPEKKNEIHTYEEEKFGGCLRMKKFDKEYLKKHDGVLTDRLKAIKTRY